MAPEELLARRIAKLEKVIKAAQDHGFKQMWSSHLFHLRQLQKKRVN
jgi:hypothetical protein